MGIARARISCLPIIKCNFFREAFISFFSGKPVPFHFELISQKLPGKHQQYLNNSFPFYRNLPNLLKKVFGSRIVKLLNDKSFVTREGLVLSSEMKLVIAATSIKISFGLRDYMLDSFHTVILSSW